MDTWIRRIWMGFLRESVGIKYAMYDQHVKYETVSKLNFVLKLYILMI